MPDLREPLAAAVAAAREAGDVLRRGMADLGRAADTTARAESLLHERLPAGELAWLVDANDGAGWYAKGQRGSAVVIVGTHAGRPVLAVVYAFAWPDHAGDLITWADGLPLTRNGERVDDILVDIPLGAEAVAFDDRLVVHLAPDADDHPHVSGQRVSPARYQCSPSAAYRMARAAVGDGLAAVADDTPILRALGEALAAAGGVLREDGGRLFFGGPSTVAALRTRDWGAAPTTPPGEPGPALVRPARYSAAQLSGRFIDDPGILSRAQGCLLGQACGDALGGLVEFEDTDTIRQRYPHGCRELLDGGTWNNLAGQPTDDTELALLLARGIVAAGRYDRDEALRAYIDWWTDPRTYDRGATIGKALSAAARGKSPEERRIHVEMFANKTSQANGSLMRISPLGVFGAGRPDFAAELAMQESEATHPHPVCGQSCAVYVGAIAHAIATGCGPRGAYDEALRQADRLHVDDAVRDVLERARLFPPADYYTNQGWVLIALQNAFYQLLHAESVEAGVVETVMSGGDTDTTAAIAGALLGAVHGRGAIPARWARAVLCCRAHAGAPTDHKRAREYWPCDVLELAELLLLAGR